MNDSRTPGAAADIAGLAVSAFEDLPQAANSILEHAGRDGGFALAINAEKIVNYRKSVELKALLETATMRYPDGVGAVMALRRKGVASARIPGADLWLETIKEAFRQGRKLRLALIGGKPAVLEATKEKLEASKYSPDIVLARDGYDGVRDINALSIAVQNSAPELVLVAMGSPRQEDLINTIREIWPSAYYLGLGGSFDVYTGRVRRAPRWMQSIGLEWLYRLLCDPRRIVRQVKYFEFMYLLKTGKL